MQKLNQRLLPLFLIMTFITCTSSTAKQPQGNGWLWKISGNGLSQPSYLFGTYHGSYDILYEYVDSIPGFHQAFNSCNQYAGEVITSTISQSSFAELDMKLPKNTTYADLLNEEDYHFLDSIVDQNLKSSLDRLYIKPSYLALFLGKLKEKEQLTKAGYSKSQIDSIELQVMDLALEKKAKEKGYTLVGLEEFSVIKMLLLSDNLKTQADELISDLREDNDYSLFSSFSKTLPEVYRTLNMKHLINFETKMDSIFQTSPRLRDMGKQVRENLLKRRNINWMEKLPELMKDKSTFIAVGVRHLPGKNGLLTFLQEKGYKVEPFEL